MELSHIDAKGNARMINVGDKPVTERVAVAEGKIFMKEKTVIAISEGATTKGNVLNTAQVAGILAAKNVGALIPMCHTLPLNGVDITFDVNPTFIHIVATAYVEAKTGVEMEALTAVSVAALTIYDMVKAIDKEMEIGEIHVLRKSGGKSGDYIRK